MAKPSTATVSSRSPRVRRRSRPHGRSGIFADLSYVFLLPGLLLYAVIVIYPTVAGGVMAFTDWRGGRESPNFVGLKNFAMIFGDPEAFGALTNTLLIAITLTIVQNIVGLSLALALNTKMLAFKTQMMARIVLRLAFFLPTLLPSVIVGFLWQFILTPSGPLNGALGAVGLDGLQQNWLGDPNVALWSVIGVVMWGSVGVTMVIYLAGLQGIPAELYEAAAIDGGSTWKQFRHVTLPLLIPATTVCLSLTLIGALKIFDQVFVMTGGGPGYATQTMSLLMYKEAFVSRQYGYSTAIALCLAMLVFAMAMLQLRFLKRFEV